jgi:hypothetical protein
MLFWNKQTEVLKNYCTNAALDTGVLPNDLPLLGG